MRSVLSLAKYALCETEEANLISTKTDRNDTLNTEKQLQSSSCCRMYSEYLFVLEKVYICPEKAIMQRFNHLKGLENVHI